MSAIPRSYREIAAHLRKWITTFKAAGVAQKAADAIRGRMGFEVVS